ncbi:hypothetical protein OUZ56_009269 [Daphnia magna]|uniref:Uncharacterized protein n=1 Tax=Daphnia magna TaxID=35525 RepID=A0ABR0AFR6_9CRUS|nr:hypothetical protein OUZ56_009269 [Daphnia magna]
MAESNENHENQVKLKMNDFYSESNENHENQNQMKITKINHIPLDPHHFKVHLHSIKVNNISTQSTWGSYPRVNDCTAIAFH